MNQRSSELKNTTYEIFIGLLSILAIVNLVLYYVIPSADVSMVITIMDSVLTVIFLSDFFYRLFTAESKSDYFFRQFGWADFLGSIPVLPQLKLLRIFRVVRVSRLLRQYGPTGIFTEFLANRATSALLSLLLFVILLLEFGGMAVLAVEQYAPDASIKTGSDAVWYTFVTITTVGYGDTYPVTNAGRLIGLLIMAVGVALFGTLTGFLSNFFIGETSVSEMIAPDTEADSPSEKDMAEDADSAADAVTPTTDDGDNPRTKLLELKRLLAEQQKSQAELARKIDEIEELL